MSSVQFCIHTITLSPLINVFRRESSQYMYINVQHTDICTYTECKSSDVEIHSLAPGDVAMVNTLRPRQSGHHFADDIFKWIFLNENVWISINISQNFVAMGPINNITKLVKVMAWRRSGDKPLSEPMMVRLPTHICVTRPQWVKKVLHRLIYLVLPAKLPPGEYYTT